MLARIVSSLAALSLVVACSSGSDDGSAASADVTAANYDDGTQLSADQLFALANVTDFAKAAAIVFPSGVANAPVLRGHVVPGGKITVVYALDRLPQCRATHDGFGIWTTRLGAQFSNGTMVSESPASNLMSFSSGGGITAGAHAVPVTIDVPAGATSVSLWVHNNGMPGPSPACDGYDSNLGKNYTFAVEAAATSVADGAGAGADDLAKLVDIGDGQSTAAILFPANPASDPVVKGKLVPGGRVLVAYALDRLSQCRATHDGYPFWTTRAGGTFSDGTKLGDAAEPTNGYATGQSGTLVAFVPHTDREGATAYSVATPFAVPANATSLALYVHNSNPGGPVSPCDAYDSKNGANYRFPVGN